MADLMSFLKDLVPSEIFGEIAKDFSAKKGKPLRDIQRSEGAVGLLKQLLVEGGGSVPRGIGGRVVPMEMKEQIGRDVGEFLFGAEDSDIVNAIAQGQVDPLQGANALARKAKPRTLEASIASILQNADQEGENPFFKFEGNSLSQGGDTTKGYSRSNKSIAAIVEPQSEEMKLSKAQFGQDLAKLSSENLQKMINEILNEEGTAAFIQGADENGAMQPSGFDHFLRRIQGLGVY